jgi:hypothetical protein
LGCSESQILYIFAPLTEMLLRVFFSKTSYLI